METVTKLKKPPKIKSIAVSEEGGLHLKWTKVEGAEKYGVKRALSDNGEFEHIAWVKKCEYIDIDAPKDVTCRYKIQAHKKLEGKKASTKLSAVKAAIISDIPCPDELKAISKDDKILLTWKKVEGAEGYIVSRRNDFYSQILPVARVNECEYTDDKIVSGQPYHYSVQPFMKTEEGEKQGNFTKEVHSVCLDKGKIVEVKASLGKKMSLKVRIVAGADGYILQRSESKDKDFTDIAKTESITDIAFTDKVEKRLKAYYYRVIAYKTVKDKEHKGEPSKPVQAKSR